MALTSYPTLSPNQPPSYRPLGWPKLTKFEVDTYKPYVHYAIGNGDCFLHSLYHNIDSLEKFPKDAPFFSNPEFVTSLPYYNVKYSDYQSLQSIFNKKGVSISKYRIEIVAGLRRDILRWLKSPAYNPQTGAYYTTDEAFDRIKRNIELIKLWFFNTFLNPRNIVYTTPKPDAIAFVDNLFSIYLQNGKDGVITLLSTSMGFRSSDNLEHLYGQDLEVIAVKGRITDFENFFWNDQLDKNFPIMQKAAQFLTSENYRHEIYKVFFLSLSDDIIRNDLRKELKSEEIPQWFTDRVKVDYDAMLNDSLEAAKVKILPDEQVIAYIESMDAWFQNIMSNRNSNDPVILKYINDEVQNRKKDSSIISKYFYNFDWGEIKDIINNNISVLDYIQTMMLKNVSESTIVNKLSKYIYRGSETLNQLILYIKSYFSIVNNVTNYIGINMNHPKYNKWSREIIQNKTYDDMIKIAKESIYFKTDKIASPEEVEQEFNTDYRTRTIEGSPAVSMYVPETDPMTRERIYISNNKPDIQVINLPININYFMLEDGFILENPVAERSLHFLEYFLPNNSFLTDGPISLMSKIFGINIHIYKSYVEGFDWRYTLYDTNVPRAPHTMINNVGNIHFEPFTIHIDNIQTGIFEHESPFTNILMKFPEYTQIDGRQPSDMEWYLLNKEHLVTAIPFPRLTPLSQLPGLTTIPITEAFENLSLKNSIMDKNKIK